MQLWFDIAIVALLIANLAVTVSHARAIRDFGAGLIVAGKGAHDHFESLRKVQQHGS